VPGADAASRMMRAPRGWKGPLVQLRDQDRQPIKRFPADVASPTRRATLGESHKPTAGRPGERGGTLPGPVRAGRRRAVEAAHPRTGVVEHDHPGRCSRGEQQQRDDPDRHRGGARHQRPHPDRRRSSAAAGAGCGVDVSHASNDYGSARTLSVGSGAGRRLTCQAGVIRTEPTGTACYAPIRRAVRPTSSPLASAPSPGIGRCLPDRRVGPVARRCRRPWVRARRPGGEHVTPAPRCYHRT
jgi:hypothetical protein